MRRFREPTLSDALAQVIEQFLCTLQSEGEDDDVSCTPAATSKPCDPDGNGRMGRFLMNAMLASGGYS